MQTNNLVKTKPIEEGKKKVYRTEWKYMLENKDLTLLKSRISELMELDPHTPVEGKYQIHSLYFDDYKDTALYTTNTGYYKRFKWRIRYYGRNLDYIVLEKKEKIEGRGHKKSCKLTLDEYNEIVSGNVENLIFDTSKSLIKELALDMMINDYRPKVIIDYERIAYVEEITNVRITFDLNVSASYDLDEFLTGDYQNYYILPSGVNLLEVKFDEILPSYIRNVVESYCFKQGSFSKYYYGRKLTDSYMKK